MSNIGYIVRPFQMDNYDLLTSTSKTSLGLVKYWLRTTLSEYRLLNLSDQRVVRRVQQVNFEREETNFIKMTCQSGIETATNCISYSLECAYVGTWSCLDVTTVLVLSWRNLDCLDTCLYQSLISLYKLHYYFAHADKKKLLIKTQIKTCQQ